METLRSTLGALADWAARRVVWFRSTLDAALAGRPDSERGQGLAEYALILSLIAVAVIGALTFFGQQLDGRLPGPDQRGDIKVFDGMPRASGRALTRRSIGANERPEFGHCGSAAVDSSGATAWDDCEPWATSSPCSCWGRHGASSARRHRGG